MNSSDPMMIPGISEFIQSLVDSRDKDVMNGIQVPFI